ncbi:MAG: hypothetical protein MI725_10145 [Pirellulales bacterium]|nr:hypothetical protein [Pirellulales bacterium]
MERQRQYDAAIAACQELLPLSFPNTCKPFREMHAKFPQSAQALEAGCWLAVAVADEEDRVTALGYVDWLLQELSLAEKRPSKQQRQLQAWAEEQLLRR